MPKYNHEKRKKYASSAVTSEHGRSSIDIECPFCQTTVRAYLWSLSGSGKKCTGCGGLHSRRGVTAPLETNG